MVKKINKAASGSNKEERQMEHDRLILESLVFNPATSVKVKLNTHDLTQLDLLRANGLALTLLNDTFPIWMPKWLQKKLKHSLRGWSDEASFWIAESIVDCYSGGPLATTGIQHIDDLLWSLYAEILTCARNSGIRLANHCK